MNTRVQQGVFWATYWLAVSLGDGLYDGRYERAAMAQALVLPVRMAMVYFVYWRMPQHQAGNWGRWLLETGAVLVAGTFLFRIDMALVVYPLCFAGEYTFSFWNAYRFGYTFLDMAFVLSLAIGMHLSREYFALHKTVHATAPLGLLFPPAPIENLPEAIIIKVNKQQVRVLLADIVYVESMKEYCKIHVQHRYWLTQLTLSQMERKLPGDRFVRIHRSYIVNCQKITAYSASEVVVEQVPLPIGKTYKADIGRKLGFVQTSKSTSEIM